MSRTRFFTTEALASAPTSVRLDEDESRHLASVMRIEVGDPVVLFDGTGYEAEGAVAEIKKGAITISRTSDPVFSPRMPKILVSLFVALPRSGAADDVIRTAIEAGAARITPLSTVRAVYRADKKDKDERERRQRRIALAAMKQSGRNVFPEFGPPTELEALDVPPDELGVFGSLAPGARHLRSLEDELGGFPKRMRVVIGPEGGLDPLEEERLIAHGFRPVILTPQILRVETAVVAFLAAFAIVPADRVRD